MARYDLTKEKERLDKVRDADFIAARSIYIIAELLVVIGWGVLILGAFTCLNGMVDVVGLMLIGGGLAALAAARFVRGFGALVENSAKTRRYNGEMLAELRRLQQMMNEPFPPEDAKQRVEDVFDKYPAE